MNHDAEEFVPIDLELRFVLFGLQAALGVAFSVPEIERVFSDDLADQVSAKEYRFHESARIALTGFVDAYEPGTMLLRLRHRDASLLSRITEDARYEIVRINKANEIARNA